MAKRLLPLVLLLLGILPLSGCTHVLQVSQQAYGISLSVDKTESGEFMVAVKLPRLSGSGSGESTGEASDYMVADATAGSFSEAMALLNATLPRTLNLSELKNVVVSDGVAQSAYFSDIITDMIEMITGIQLSQSAQLIVCTGSARDFIEQQQPTIGTRLSRAITEELNHYEWLGISRPTTLTDVYFQMNSLYGDTAVTLAALNSGQGNRPVAAGRTMDAYPGALPRNGDSQVEYMGSALLNSQQMVGVLTGLETQLLNLLSGEEISMHYLCDGRSITLGSAGHPRVKVDCSADIPVIQIGLKITAGPAQKVTDTHQLMTLLQADILDLIAHCQSLGVEPFGFAQYAAKNFWFYKDFQDYRWPDKFKDAKIELDIDVTILEG